MTTTASLPRLLFARSTVRLSKRHTPPPRHPSRHANRTTTTTILLRHSSGIDKVAENKIAEWLHQGGAKEVKNKGGGKLKRNDLHKELATSFGVQQDYFHSKILKDNNFRPESIERRMELDEKWEQLRTEIQHAYREHCPEQKQQPTNTTTNASATTVLEFTNHDWKRRNPQQFQYFYDRIQDLDHMARRVNQAIISDSLRFNGRSPVPHARRFHFYERILEAVREDN